MGSHMSVVPIAPLQMTCQGYRIKFACCSVLGTICWVYVILSYFFYMVNVNNPMTYSSSLFIFPKWWLLAWHSSRNLNNQLPRSTYNSAFKHLRSSEEDIGQIFQRYLQYYIFLCSFSSAILKVKGKEKLSWNKIRLKISRYPPYINLLIARLVANDLWSHPGQRASKAHSCADIIPLPAGAKVTDLDFLVTSNEDTEKK